jgi:cobalt-zinc-cadmium efflux system outer membrane protein
MRYSNLPVMQALLVLFILLILSATALGSQEATEHAPSITLQEAVSRALANNPSIKATRIDADIEQARRDALALGTPYKLHAEIENFAGSGTTSDFDSSETTLQLSKTLELGKKRQHRTELGDAQLGLAQLEISIGELELVAEVSRRYVALLRQQEQIDLSEEAAAINDRTLDIVRRRVAVGIASEAEESSVLVTLSRTKLIARRLGFELASARVDLATLWGSTQPSFTEVVGDIYSNPSLPAYEELQARLAGNPQVLRVSTEDRIRDAQRRLAQSGRRPNLELSGGVRHLGATDDMALVVALSMPFGSKGRAEPFVREADTQITKAPLTRDQHLLELQATLYGFYQSLLASRDELGTLQHQIIPEAQRALQFYEHGFEVGSYSLLELTAAQEHLLTLRHEALDAAASFHLTLIEIESLLGSANPGGMLP